MNSSRRSSTRRPDDVPASSEWAAAFASGLRSHPTQQSRRGTVPSTRERVVVSATPQQSLVAGLAGALAVATGVIIWQVSGGGPARPAAQPVEEPSPPAVTLRYPPLADAYRLCAGDEFEPEARLLFDIGKDGSIGSVRLVPDALAQTQCGAKLLRAAWEAELGVIGQARLAVPLSSATAAAAPQDRANRSGAEPREGSER